MSAAPRLSTASIPKAPANVAQAAKAAGVKALVHMSALGVDRAAEVSAYAASKLAGEAAVLEAFPRCRDRCGPRSCSARATAFST